MNWSLAIALVVLLTAMDVVIIWAIVRFLGKPIEIPDGFDIICVGRSKATDPRCDLGCSLRGLVAAAIRHCSRPPVRNVKDPELESRCRPDPDEART